MATLSKQKLEALKKAFIEDAMSPGQAATKVGVTPATANRYYEKWEKEIRKGLEERLLPQLQESVKKLSRKRKK
jgi:hypothetical protein